ncbi:MAG: AbrB/MazE/SpoVT family DNA-binding domain-containing protein [Acidimicrobiia bacterium]
MTLSTTMRERGQLTIPAEIREAIELKAGDILEFEVVDGRIVITPKIVIDPDQAWFWTERWQKMEREADADFAAGRFRDFDNVEDFLADLDN